MPSEPPVNLLVTTTHLVDDGLVGQRADVEVCSVWPGTNVVRVGDLCTDAVRLLLLNQLAQDEHLALQICPRQSLLMLDQHLRPCNIPMSNLDLVVAIHSWRNAQWLW